VSARALPLLFFVRQAGRKKEIDDQGLIRMLFSSSFEEE
jgi:hypothetical protein